MRFLDLFQKVRVEFSDANNEHQCYLPVDWSKTKSDVGSAFDCLQMTRNFRDGAGNLHDLINVKVQMYLE